MAVPPAVACGRSVRAIDALGNKAEEPQIGVILAESTFDKDDAIFGHIRALQSYLGLNR